MSVILIDKRCLTNTMSDKAVSSNSGLYGESIYPPMFDSEPPPLDDEDGDPSDDDFADFTSFQRTGSDSNNWGSWSNWSGSAGIPTKVGGIDGTIKDTSVEVATQDNKEHHRSETRSSPIQSGGSEEVSQFETFSTNSSSDLVFNGEVDQRNSLITGSLGNEPAQLHIKLENQNVEKLSCNGSEFLEDSSSMTFIHKANSHVEGKSDPSTDIFEVNFDRSTNISNSSNGMYKDVTEEEKLDEKVANIDNEDEFDDFADFKTNTTKDGFFLSSFDEEKEFVKNNNLRSFEESSLKLQNECMEFQDKIGCTKADGTLGASDITKTPDSFDIDFPPMHDNTLVNNSFSTESKDSGQSRDSGKNEILAVSSTESDSFVSNVHKSLHDKSNFQCDDENQSSNIAGLETFDIHAVPGIKSLNETVASDEKNLFENMNMNQSLSCGEDSLSIVESAASDHEILGSSRDINVDNSDNSKKDMNCMNGFENQSDTGEDSKIKMEFLSSRSTDALSQKDIDNENEFDDFQSTNAFETISEDENKHTFADYKNVQINEFDSSDMTDVHNPNSTPMLEEVPKQQAGSSNLDFFTGKESFIQQNHHEIDFKGIDECEDFQKITGSDTMANRLESPSEMPATEMKSNVHDSCNRNSDKIKNCVDKFEDIKGLAHSNEFVNKNESPLESMNAKRSFRDSDYENKNIFSSHGNEFNDFKNCATSMQNTEGENQQKNTISSKEITGDGADPASFLANSSQEETDDFDDFQNFSTATDNSLKNDPGDMSKMKAESGWGNSTESNKEDNEGDSWASFGSAGQSIQSNNVTDSDFGSFAAFPAKEQQDNIADNDGDANWASFSSPQSDNSFQSLPSLTKKEFVPENEFGSTYKQVEVMQSNPLDTKMVDSSNRKVCTYYFIEYI